MSDIKKILDLSTPPAQQEKLIEQLIDRKFDAELKSEWADKLGKEYGTTQQNDKDNPAQQRNVKLWLTLAAVAAVLIILLWSLKPFSSQVSADELAKDYIASAEMYDIRAAKGQISDDQQRITAIQAFNQKSYQAAIAAYADMSMLLADDLYYLGLAQLQLNDYPAAAASLKGSLQQNPSEQLREEISWYLSLSQVLQSDAAAISWLRAMPEDSWKYEEAQRLIRALEQ